MNATDYIEQHWKTNAIWTHLDLDRHRDRLRNCADYVIGKRCADIGCGFGHSTDVMRQYVPHAEWVGVDFWHGVQEEGPRWFPGIEFHYCPDWSALKNLGAFSTVICSEVIEHVDDDRGAVEALMSIAGRRCVLTTPNTHIDDPGHLRVYREADLRKLFAGYKYKITSTGIFWYVVCDLDGPREVQS